MPWFVIGASCLVVVVFLGVLRRRYWRRRGWYGGHGYGRCHGGGRFGRGGRWATYRAFQVLDTTPGQEKAIRAALGELSKAFGELRPELADTRSQLAQTIGGEQFDAAGFEATLERQTAALGRMAPVASRTLAQIHDALDPDQRRRLARLLERGEGYCAV
jgi:Spy/CpxP family protein refolding chaperone